MRKIRHLLVANRSEITIRVFRAAPELGIGTIAIYAEEDKLSLHRLGAGKGALAAYLSIEDVVRVAKEAKADAIHPGYGFLSESPVRDLGNKLAPRDLAASCGVPVMPASPPLPDDSQEIRCLAGEIG